MARFTEEELVTAWERVRENEGCAGVDGVTLAKFGQDRERRLARLGEAAADGSYRALPLMKILVEKIPGKTTKLRRLLAARVKSNNGRAPTVCRVTGGREATVIPREA